MDQDKIKKETKILNGADTLQSKLAKERAHSRHLIDINSDSVKKELEKLSHDALVDYTARIMEILSVCQIEAHTRVVQGPGDDPLEIQLDLDRLNLGGLGNL